MELSVKSTGRPSVRLIGGCIAAAIAWQYLYSTYLVAPYFAASPPPWLRRIHLWMPDALSVRLLNAFGSRFDVANYDGNTGIVLASIAIEFLVWTALFCVAAISLNRVRRKHHETAPKPKEVALCDALSS